jgi:hypothetical protein
MKIGITFDPPNATNEIFANGIKQNSIFLCETLQNCNFDVSLILSPGKWHLNDVSKFSNKNLKVDQYENVDNYDLIFQVTFQIPKDKIIELRSKGKKIILYSCGNEYIVVTEKTLFGGVSRFEMQYSREQLFDEIWTIPQHTNTNYHFWKILFRTQVREVPPIWSPQILEFSEREFLEKEGTDFLYKKRDTKSVAIFEPNINVLKWFLPPLLVCESAYRNGTNISHVYLTNLANKKEPFNLDLANKIVKNLDLFNDKKLSIEGRYNTLQFMSKYADYVVSHQWENALNYLYLDLAWWGWPVIHNASLCKEIGYYYEGFNYEEGGEILKKVIENHNFEQYLEENRKKLDRFLPSNKKLIEKYKELVNRLFL